jgi:hypothetical protein
MIDLYPSKEKWERVVNHSYYKFDVFYLNY